MSTSEIVSILALLVAAGGFLLNGKKSAREDAGALGEIRGKLGSISAGIDDLRVEMRAMREKQSSMSAEIIGIKADLEGLEARFSEHMKRWHGEER